jgi:hypothetical protein
MVPALVMLTGNNDGWVVGFTPFIRPASRAVSTSTKVIGEPVSRINLNGPLPFNFALNAM